MSEKGEVDFVTIGFGPTVLGMSEGKRSALGMPLPFGGGIMIGVLLNSS